MEVASRFRTQTYSYDSPDYIREERGKEKEEESSVYGGEGWD